MYKNLFFALLLVGSASVGASKIGFLIMATGSYTKYVPPLVRSIEQYVLKDHSKQYFVFTDGQLEADFMEQYGKQITITFQKRLGWPFDTLKRFEVYHRHKALYEQVDYLCAIDADMRFVSAVGKELLVPSFMTKHFAFEGKHRRQYTYETRPVSSAYVPHSKGKHYVCGGFYGGERDIVIDMLKHLCDAVAQDLSRGVIAVWHDESHLNRLCVDKEPASILPGKYCVAEEHQQRCPHAKLISCYKAPKERSMMCPNRKT